MEAKRFFMKHVFSPFFTALNQSQHAATTDLIGIKDALLARQPETGTDRISVDLHAPGYPPGLYIREELRVLSDMTPRRSEYQYEWGNRPGYPRHGFNSPHPPPHAPSGHHYHQGKRKDSLASIGIPSPERTTELPALYLEWLQATCRVKL